MQGLRYPTRKKGSGCATWVNPAQVTKRERELRRAWCKRKWPEKRRHEAESKVTSQLPGPPCMKEKMQRDWKKDPCIRNTWRKLRNASAKSAMFRAKGEEVGKTCATRAKIMRVDVRIRMQDLEVLYAKRERKILRCLMVAEGKKDLEISPTNRLARIAGNKYACNQCTSAQYTLTVLGDVARGRG